MDAEPTSQRLRLLQDLCSSLRLFPEVYWMDGDLPKGPEITRGGEATLYKARYRGDVVVVRQFFIPVEPPDLADSKQRSMIRVSNILSSHLQIVVDCTY